MAVMLERHDPESLRVEVDGRRHYRCPALGGAQVASVTSVLAATSDIESSWGFRRWRDNLEAIEPGLSDAARDIAAERGTRVHDDTTRCLTTGAAVDDSDPWMASLAPTIRQWRAIATLALADGAVWHGFDRVAGTVDFVLRIAGGWWLFDLKTSAKPWPQSKIGQAIAQLGGYSTCLEWTYDLELSGCGLLVALPDAPAQVVLSGPRSFSVADARAAWSDRLAAFRGLRD